MIEISRLIRSHGLLFEIDGSCVTFPGPYLPSVLLSEFIALGFSFICSIFKDVDGPCCLRLTFYID